MKTTRTLINGLVAGGIALALVSTLAAQTTTEGTAKVIRMKGDARYLAGKDWKPLKVGDVLRPGAVVQTSVERGSFVDLLLREGDSGQAASAKPAASAEPAAKGNAAGQPASGSAASPTSTDPSRAAGAQNVIRIGENSVLGIEKLTFQQTGMDVVTETSLDLKAGSLKGNVKKISKASRYEVKFPNGVAGIRGTFYEIDASGTVKVYYGSAIVAWVNPTTHQAETILITAGQQFNPATAVVNHITGKFEPQPISAADMAIAAQTVTTLGYVPSTPATPVPVTVQQTLIYVSPTGP